MQMLRRKIILNKLSFRAVYDCIPGFAHLIVLTRLFARIVVSEYAPFLFWRWSRFDQKLYEFYRQFIGRGDLVFDVGANLGNRAKVFHRLGAVVVAIEPQPACVRFLKGVFRNRQRFCLVESALGAQSGVAEMLVGEVNTISTLSRDWVKAVKNSGRFAQFDWNQKIEVPLATLDRLVERFGTPAFIKVDVEGFEHEVLRGLSRPVGAISFEFVPEFLSSTMLCLDQLESISACRYQISLGESMAMHLSDWTDVQGIKLILSRLSSDVFGDIYVKFG